MQSLMTSGVSSYNALQMVLQKTSSMGLTFQVSYTYSKAMADIDQITTGQISTSPAVIENPFNPHLDNSLAGFDQRHTLVINGAYQMPFDKWVSSGLAKRLVGGWSVNGIYSYGTGLPVTVLYGANQSGDGDSNNPDRPNLKAGFQHESDQRSVRWMLERNSVNGGHYNSIGDCPAGTPLHTTSHWFDPCAFGPVTPGAYGNLGRNTVIGPGTSDMDFTIVKLTPITERMKLEFRAEAFNLLNHPMFGLVNNAIFTGKNTLVPTPSVTCNATPTAAVCQVPILYLQLKRGPDYRHLDRPEGTSAWIKVDFLISHRGGTNRKSFQ